jgi:peptide/nickel transport system substrate-binding protein
MKRFALAICMTLAAGAAGAQERPFRLAHQGDIVTLDPVGVNETHTLALLGAAYEPLVRRGRALELEPALATRWEVVSPTRWRFHLRPNVRFHDGRPFTADDVVFSIERTKRQGSDLLSRVASIAGARKIDDRTVEIDTTVPDPTLLANLSQIYILSKAWAEANNATDPENRRQRVENFATRNANGTGQMRIVRRVPDTETVFQRNPDWWDRQAGQIAEAIYLPVANPATRVAALISGQVDMIFPVPLQDIPRLAQTAGVKVMEGLDLRTIFLGMEQFKPEIPGSNIRGRNPFADKRVREAVYRAIDVETIRRTIMRGRATPAALLNGEGIEGFDAAQNMRLPYDPAIAKRLLAEAGYPDGFEMPMNCPNNRYVNDEQICQAVAQMLAVVGIKINLQAEPAGPYFARLARRESPFWLLGTTPPTYDSFSTLFGLAMCRPDTIADGRTPIQGQGAFNHGGYCNPRMDAALTSAMTELDPARRRGFFADAWRVMRDDVAYIPLHQQALAWAMRDNVDLVQRADDVIEFRFVRLR